MRRVGSVFGAAVGLFAFLGASMASASDTTQAFAVLKKSDFEEITGCKVSDYRRPLESALRFLVFPDSEIGNSNNVSIHYSRRHTAPLFRDLLHENGSPGGVLPDECLPPSLRAIALALRILDPAGRYTGQLAPVSHVYDNDLIGDEQPSARAFPVMSRAAYMERTGCLISPNSYDRYRTAFGWVVLRSGYDDRARTEMAEFLEDLFASRPVADGFVNQACMVDSVARVAAELGLLDAEGRYRSQR